MAPFTKSVLLGFHGVLGVLPDEDATDDGRSRQSFGFSFSIDHADQGTRKLDRHYVALDEFLVHGNETSTAWKPCQALFYNFCILYIRTDAVEG